MHPEVRKCDILVTMSQSALDKHLKDLKDDGILLVDDDIVQEIPKIKAKIFKVPATRIAEVELGSKIYANIVMLGALTKIAGIPSKRAFEKAIIDIVPKETKENNLDSFKKGFEFTK